MAEIRKFLGVRVSPDVYAALREYAREHRWSLSSANEQLLVEALLRSDRQRVEVSQ